MVYYIKDPTNLMVPHGYPCSRSPVEQHAQDIEIAWSYHSDIEAHGPRLQISLNFA
jgi:hypothetical protein